VESGEKERLGHTDLPSCFFTTTFTLFGKGNLFSRISSRSRPETHLPQDVGPHQQDPRVVQEHLLERGDGTHASGAAVLREDDVRQCYCSEYFRSGCVRIRVGVWVRGWFILCVVVCCVGGEGVHGKPGDQLLLKKHYKPPVTKELVLA